MAVHVQYSYLLLSLKGIYLYSQLFIESCSLITYILHWAVLNATTTASGAFLLTLTHCSWDELQLQSLQLLSLPLL